MPGPTLPGERKGAVEGLGLGTTPPPVPDLKLKTQRTKPATLYDMVSQCYSVRCSYDRHQSDSHHSDTVGGDRGWGRVRVW